MLNSNQNLAAVAQDSFKELAFFVPTDILLGNTYSSSIVYRTRLGAVVIDSAWIGDDRLTIFLEDGRQYHCLKSAFGGLIPEEFKDAIKHAVSNKIPVYLAVGVGKTGTPARDYFCGISPFGPQPAARRPDSGSTNF